ncbi:unnamed protein product, partial [Polarella glacialis]
VMAAAMDPAWNEVWLPAAFKDASSFWGAVDPAAAPDSTHLQTLPLKELVRRQEDVLQDCFFQCLRELQVAKSNGKLQSFWPRGSTLLGLLRHGRLFGHFENGQTDCVGDDIDFTIRLPQAEGASRNASETGNGSWPRFVRAMADALKAHGYDCWVGARAERLALPGGIYEQLLCNRETNGFVCPVSFVRAQDEALTPETSTCSAYGQPVECPSTVRILKELANYGGCPALPNIELAALTIGNGCVEWMRNGLAQEQLAELKSRAAKLQSQSFASMQPVWDSPSCSAERIAANEQLVARSNGTSRTTVRVGSRPGAALRDYYGQVPTSWPSCFPAQRPEGDKDRCRFQRDLARQMQIMTKAKLGKAGLALVVDGISACCAAGPSVLEVEEDRATVCVGPRSPDIRKGWESQEGSYDLERLHQLCLEQPSVLVLDVTPSAAGQHAVFTMLSALHCRPSGALVASGLIQQEYVQQAILDFHMNLEFLVSVEDPALSAPWNVWVAVGGGKGTDT